MKTTITKLIFSLAFFIVMGYSFAQAPQAFNYQAVARDASGSILSNHVLGIKATLHRGSASGTVDYSEKFTTTTNEFGLFTLAIGTGTTLSGNFSTITWSSGNYWLQVQMDPAGGTTYTDMGTSQLLSVPYAMYAESSNDLPGGASGQTLRYDGTSWVANSVLYNNGTNVGIGVATPAFKLDVNGSARVIGNVGIGTSTPQSKLDVNGDVRVNGKVIPVNKYTNNALPVAYGYVNANGTLGANCTSNIASATYNNAYNGKCYEITITGEPYFYAYYVTIVTPLDFAVVCTGSADDQLLVYFQDLTGAPVQRAFSFVVYKP